MERGPNSSTRLLERAVHLGWPRERVEIIDEDLGKSGVDAFRHGGFQYLLAEMSLARAGLVLSYDASRLARTNRDWYQLRAASARSSAP
jgi:DNA invertase Pin-like site-specific DNA recombinase